MGRGSLLATLVALAALTAFPASAFAAASPDIPDPSSLLGSSAPPSAPANAPGPDLPQTQAPQLAAPPQARSVLAALADALGVVGGGVGAIAGGVAHAAGAIAGAFVAFLAALVGAAAALVGGLASGLANAAGRLASRPERVDDLAAGAAGSYALASARAHGIDPLAKLRAGFAALYSRLQDNELLRNDARRRIYDFVQTMPGAHVSQVCNAMGLGWGTTVYHLNRLREGQLLTVKRAGNQVCHFINGGTHSADEQRMLLATKTPKAQAIVDFLALRGPSTQARIADDLGMSSALVSWHAKRLEDMGVVQRARQGRTCTLALTGPAPLRPAQVRPLAPAAPLTA
jgi:DNA-binding transcriptional ArsR family regulator